MRNIKGVFVASGLVLLALASITGLGWTEAAPSPAAPAAVAAPAAPVAAAAPAAPAPMVPAEEMLITEIPQVITASRVSESAKTSPATIYVITAQQIKDRGYQDLKDIFLDLPGVDLTANVGGENGGWQVVARGLIGNNKIQVLQDGISMNPPSGDRFVWGNNISLEKVDRIEVLFGPASALYGADAMGGVINVITKKGADVKGGEAKLAVGNVQTSTGSLLYGQKFPNDVDIVASARFFYSKGFDFKGLFPDVYGELDTRAEPGNTDPESRQFEAPIQDYNVFAKLTYKDFTLTLSRNHYHENNTRGEDVSNYVMDQYAYWAFDQDLVSMKYNLALSDSAQLISTLTYSRYQVDNDSNYLFWWGDAYQQLESKETKLEEQLNVDILKDLKGVFGVEASETANLPFNSDLTASARPDPNGVQYMPNPWYGYVNADGQTVPFAGTGLLSERKFAAYGQLKYSALDNLSFVLGDRYDTNSYYGYNVNTPRAGAVYQPTDKATVKLLYGTAFISPSLWANNEFWMTDPLGAYGHVTPNILGIKLKPETSQSFELNAGYEISPKWTANADVYYSLSKDVIQGQYFWGTLPIVYTQGATPVIYGIETAINQGDQTTVGADLTTKMQVLPGWEVSGSYSYTHGTVKNPSDIGHESVDLYKVATHKGIIGITGHFLDHFSAFVRERLVGAINTLHSNQFVGSDFGGNNLLPAYATTDINLRCFDYLPGLELDLSVTNLFDLRYYGDGLETEGGNYIGKIPFDPRTVLVSLGYKF